MVADLVIIADQFMPVGVDHRQHAIDEGRDRRRRILLEPVVVFLLGEKVARPGEGWHPAAVLQPRVPAHVIDMQVRAHHEIDVINRDPGGIECAQICVVSLHVPFRTIGSRLVVADAAVDQDGVMRRLHDIGLEAEHQDVLLIQRACLPHPISVLGQHLGRQSRQHLQRRDERRLLLDDALNGEIADRIFQAHARFPS
ncbi:hypothetical protein ACVIIW_001270 [Bradyrhizobium sp. USDA 4449]